MNELLVPGAEVEKSRQRFNLMDDPGEILTDLATEIDRVGPGEKVWLRTLDILAGKFTNKLIPHLKHAARRGADVRIMYDPITTYRTHGIPTWTKEIPLYPERAQMDVDFQKTIAMVEELKETDGINMIQSKPDSKIRQIFPYIGADHLKGWVVGEKAYFGDKNLEDMTFYDMSGFVVKISDPILVSLIADVIGKTGPTTDDVNTSLNNQNLTRLIYDRGISGQSEIYDKANKMIINAPKGTYIGVSFPLFPSGKILANLIEAHRSGKQIEAVTTRSDFFSAQPPIYTLNRMAEKSMRWKNDSNLRFNFSNQGVHAKYLIVGDAVLFGSNNLAESGIRAGTAELDIYSTDPELVKQVNMYHRKLVLAARTGTPTYAL